MSLATDPLLLALSGLIAATTLLLALALSVSRRGVAVTHDLLFGIALVFYWVFPVAVGLLVLFPDAPGMAWWHGIFAEIPRARLTGYLASVAGLGAAFFVGSVMGQRPLAELHRLGESLTFDRRLLRLFLLAALVPAAYYAYGFREVFFSGYTELRWDDAAAKGPFVSAGNLLLGIAWLYALHRKLHRGLSVRQALLNPYAAAYLVVGVLILSLGGRLYFVASLIMFAVFYTQHYRRLGFGKSALWLAAALGFATAVGLWRQGGSSLASGGFLLAVESLYTSFSLISYLADNDLQVLNAPIFLLSGFITLIPTLVFPEKTAWLLDPHDYGFSYISPVGAMNSFVSLDINFGVGGGVVAFFVLGLTLSQLRALRGSALAQVVYIMLCGFLPLTFFRDSFAISVVKNWFQFSFALPLLLALAAHVFTRAGRRAQREPA
jgi:hypothetical protein